MQLQKDLAQEMLELFTERSADAGQVMAALSYLSGLVAYESGMPLETVMEGMNYSIRLVYEARENELPRDQTIQ